MRTVSSLLLRVTAAAVAVLAVASVAACGGNPTRDVLESVGVGPEEAETPDFVAQTRPESLDYMPVGTAEPGRPTPARTPEEVKAAEAELDALRARNEAAGAAAARLGRTPAPEPVTLPLRKPNSNQTP